MQDNILFLATQSYLLPVTSHIFDSAMDLVNVVDDVDPDFCTATDLIMARESEGCRTNTDELKLASEKLKILIEGINRCDIN